MVEFIRWKKFVLVAGVLSFLIIFSGLPAAAESPPLTPAAYWGSVHYSTGGGVASGMVEAYIDGDLKATAGIQDGFYGGAEGLAPKLVLEGTPDTVGKAVYFRVNGFAATPGVIWSPGDTRRVDLDAGLRCGDVNRSGSVTAADAALVLRAAAGKVSLAPDQQRAADVDGNGAVNGTDAGLILRRAVNLIENFPAETDR